LSRANVFDGLALSCGLAGGLREGVPTGSVLIPRRVVRADGTVLECDAQAVQALDAAARELGYEPLADPMVTQSTLVYGKEPRAALAARGFAGVDMETGLIGAPRVACVRVVLDTPQREISPVWLHPAKALFTPRAWADLPMLIVHGNRCARIAARVAAKGASSL
jgi:hypothetical protein